MAAQSSKNNKRTWLEFVEVTQLWKIGLNLSEEFELDEIQANSIQPEPSGWTSDIQLGPSSKLCLGWEYCLSVALGVESILQARFDRGGCFGAS